MFRILLPYRRSHPKCPSFSLCHCFFHTEQQSCRLCLQLQVRLIGFDGDNDFTLLDFFSVRFVPHSKGNFILVFRHDKPADFRKDNGCDHFGASLQPYKFFISDAMLPPIPAKFVFPACLFPPLRSSSPYPCLNHFSAG